MDDFLGPITVSESYDKYVQKRNNKAEKARQSIENAKQEKQQELDNIANSVFKNENLLRDTFNDYQLSNEDETEIEPVTMSGRISRQINESDDSDSQEPRSELEAKFQKETRDNIDKNYDLYDMMLASNPSYNPNDSYFANMQDSLNNEREIAKNTLDGKAANSGFAADYNRRMYDENGEFLGPNMNLLGFTSQQKTGGSALDIYNSIFEPEDQILGPVKGIGIDFRDSITKDDINKTYNGYETLLTTNSSYDPNDPLFQNMQQALVNGRESESTEEDVPVIDDGRYNSREALYMTGDQYLKYVNAGLPGRKIKDIDPNEIYSKQDEMENYGFIPYLVTDDGVDRFHDQASMNVISNAMNGLADARRAYTDYDLNIDGETISGKAVDKQANSYMRNLSNQFGDENLLYYSPDQASNNAVPLINTYSLTLNDGTVITQDAPKGEELNIKQYDDGSLVIDWSDGSQWLFDDIDDLNNSLGRDIRIAGEDELDQANLWADWDPMILEDGTTIRADAALDLLSDPDKYADYGLFNWNKPISDSPLEGGNFLPWLVDIALGSAPLFYTPVAGSQAVANAYGNSLGMQAGRDDYLNGTYSMLSDSPTQEEIGTAVAGSLALPLTERLWGNIGLRAGSKFFGKDLSKYKPLTRYLMGTVGEGMEEIPGNIVEEIQRNGISNFYANPILDENGNKMYDNQGRAIRDSDTNWIDRSRNFIADIPESVLGGAALGATIGATAIPAYKKQYQNNKIKKELDDLGIEDFIPANLVVDLTEDELNYYND